MARGKMCAWLKLMPRLNCGGLLRAMTRRSRGGLHATKMGIWRGLEEIEKASASGSTQYRYLSYWFQLSSALTIYVNAIGCN